MNWLEKTAQQSGFLVPELPYRRWNRWSDRQKIVAEMRTNAQTEANKIAEKNGHRLGQEWNSLNGNYCTKCGRQVYIRIGDWYDSLNGTRLEGPVVTEECKKYSTIGYPDDAPPFAVPDYRSLDVCGKSYPGSDNM